MIVEHLPKTGCQTDLGEAQHYIVNYSDTYTSLFLRVSCVYEFMLTRTRAPKCHFYISDFSDVSTKNFFLHSMKVSRGVKKVITANLNLPTGSHGYIIDKIKCQIIAMDEGWDHIGKGRCRYKHWDHAR